MLKLPAPLLTVTNVLLIGFLLLPLYVTAGEMKGMRVNSVRLKSQNQRVALIEVACSIDANHRSTMVSGLAYSGDRTNTSHRGSSSPAIGPGLNSSIIVSVLRPPEPSAHVTDKFLVTLMDVDSLIRSQHTFEFRIQWEAISESDAQTGSAGYIYDPDSLNWISRNYFVEGQYAALDELLNRWNDPLQRDLDGQWRLSHFLEGIQQEFRDGKWGDNMRRLKEWKNLTPNSIALAMVEAAYWFTYADSVLGSVLNDRGDHFALDLATRRFTKARKILLNVKSNAIKYPVWYELYILISNGLRRVDKRVMSEVFRKYPDYYPVYISVVEYLLSKDKSNIDWGEVDDVITNIADNAKTVDGGVSYGTLYVLAAKKNRWDVNPFARTNADGWRLLRSLEERVNRFPSQKNINELAACACAIGNSQVYSNARARLRYVAPGAWLNNNSLDLCDRRFLRSA